MTGQTAFPTEIRMLILRHMWSLTAFLASSHFEENFTFTWWQNILHWN